MTYRAPKGTDDIFPPASRTWDRAERVFRDLSARFGYELLLTPLFESTELFARGVGEATEVVDKQMYTFKDKGGRSLTLRPEGTAPIVRALIERGGVSGTFKGAYWGPMFRYERPQKGRRRQFYQGGVEYVGEPTAAADVEVIEFGYRYLEELGLPGVTVLLNSIGDAADRIAYREALLEYLEERRDELSEDSQARMYLNPLRVLDSRADAAVTADAPHAADYLGEAAAEHFAEVRSGLEALSIPYVLEPRLVRGLDYYNRTVWEYVPEGYEAAQDSVGGGGRYDPLFELLGGKPTPGVGLAMGVDRIILALGERADDHALDVFIIVADPQRHIDAFNLASHLRRDGLRVDLDLGDRSVKAQFRAADRRRARGAIVVGEEWDGGQVVARDLESGEQETILMEEIGSWVQNR